MGLQGDSGLCYIVLVSDLRLGNGRKHWRGDVMELLGLPTNTQVCTMLTHEPCGVPPLSGHRQIDYWICGLPYDCRIAQGLDLIILPSSSFNPSTEPSDGIAGDC